MMSSRIVLLLLWLLLASTALLLLCDGIPTLHPHVVCSEKEKTALLNFKQGLTWDPSNMLLSSWSPLQQDCCTWTGVHCNNVTGRVIHLHLSSLYNWEYDASQQLGGKISPSLVELESLSYLDLSWNNFSGSTIPSFFGSMPSLRYLNLSFSNFEGLIPHQLGNLSSLRVLDLSDNDQLYVDGLSWIARLHSLEYLDLSWIDLHKAATWHQSISKLFSLSELHLAGCRIEGLIPHALGNLSSLRYLDLSYNDQLIVDDLSWIAGLHSLEYLDMSRVDLHRAINWLQEVSMLPSLSQLHLSGCLEKMIPPLAFVNFTSLKVLDLSDNHFNCKIQVLLSNHTRSLMSLDLSYNSLYGQIPDDLGQLKHLEFLSLSGNSLYGPIPASIGNLSSLRLLDLSANKLFGPIPASIGNLSSLRLLDLSANKLNGTLPNTMGFLSNLEELDVADNSIAGIVSEASFAKLSKLKELYTRSNSLFFNMSSNWVPPFQLDTLDMSSCKMGPRFPLWLRTQTSLNYLDISQSGISSTAPEWLWKWVSRIDYINLSNNQINGDMSNVLLNSSVVQMTSNRFEGQLPRLSPNVKLLNLANNSFSGPISPFLCQEMNVESLLRVLDLSNNILSGELSHCSLQWQYLANINLGRNNLSGKIPNSMGSLRGLRSLQLHNNNFLGEIPPSVRNCTSLSFINLGGNELIGLIPNWIGDMLHLEILSLRSNKFIGDIPTQICQLSNLKILDLGINNLSGPIPKCLKNISAMITTDSFYQPSFENIVMFGYFRASYTEILSLVTKGRESEYQKILELVTSIDLSSNNISGSIPYELFSLHALRFLNLSRNQITGKVPKNIGAMATLESLDLSRNHLSSEIPQSMSNLTFINYLDLSYNNFSGRIPLSTQLQSFNATSYIENSELCGAPLNNNCTREEESQGRGVTSLEKEEEEYEMVWFYIGMGPGFVVGFWVVCGTLILKRAWRHAYFQLLDDMKDRIYLAILLKVIWLRRKFKRSSDT